MNTSFIALNFIFIIEYFFHISFVGCMLESVPLRVKNIAVIKCVDMSCDWMQQYTLSKNNNERKEKKKKKKQKTTTKSMGNDDEK